MAPLNDAAEAARAHAARLRIEAQGLKVALRDNLAGSRERLDTARVQADRARARRAIPYASPWSGLEWCREDEQLHSVLVPVD